jgi:hypothetical protein
MDIMREVALVAGVVVGVLALLIGTVAWAVNYASFPAEVAVIEQLRSDFSKVEMSEYVVGQATAVNQQIRSNQAWNKVPIICLTVPNGWDAVEPIDVEARPPVEGR